MLLVESSNHGLDLIFGDLNMMRFGCDAENCFNAFYLFAIGRPCNIPWRRSELNLKLA
jgi:hypothetical protein